MAFFPDYCKESDDEILLVEGFSPELGVLFSWGIMPDFSSIAHFHGNEPPSSWNKRQALFCTGHKHLIFSRLAHSPLPGRNSTAKGRSAYPPFSEESFLKEKVQNYKGRFYVRGHPFLCRRFGKDLTRNFLEEKGYIG